MQNNKLNKTELEQLIKSTKVFRIDIAKSNTTFLYFTHTTDKQIILIHCTRFRKNTY